MKFLFLISAAILVNMVQCAAISCTVKSGQGLNLYLFPKDAKLRKIWALILKRDGFEPSEYTKFNLEEILSVSSS
jgi:hypothetical protein